MPIINAQIKGQGGVQPSGTISIQNNGTYDITTYAVADVQVPTTAPESYRVFQKDLSGKLVNSTSTPWIPLPAGTTDVGDYCLTNAYLDTPSSVLSGVIDLSSLKEVSGANALQRTFQNCVGITGINLSSLEYLRQNTYMCFCMCQNSTGITSVDLRSLKEITNAHVCRNMFSGCTGLLNVNLSSLSKINGNSTCNLMFQNCTSLINVDLSSLMLVDQNSAIVAMFKGCSSLTSFNFYSLTRIRTTNSCNELFSGCVNLISLYFPSITPNTFGTQTNFFSNMLQFVTGCTVHFPSNVQTTIGSWTTVLNGFGGTNTTVLFDLPATNTLTGADTNIYTRNPKYDTATALAWKVGAYETTDFTPAYYTSGITDPQVNGTIYSDSACTTAITTIDSIA